MNPRPALITPEALLPRLAEPDLRIVDLRAADYAKGHVPSAQPFSLAALVRAAPPVMGLLPDPAGMAHTMSVLGIEPDSLVVAYDEEGGGWAARLLWNLEAYGHHRYALLDGGWEAWATEGYPQSTEPVSRYRPTALPVRLAHNVADRAYVLSRLGSADTCLLDCRSPPEYRGLDRRAARAGHIPGAVNLEWTEVMDTERNLRLLPEPELRSRFLEIGANPEREIIPYCQTNHRSALIWLALKSLGYPRVRNYDGAWSDWGNAPDTPIA
jgi:thiosulfate/3-mercaptopyruvate sulfurtransferase